MLYQLNLDRLTTAGLCNQLCLIFGALLELPPLNELRVHGLCLDMLMRTPGCVTHFLDLTATNARLRSKGCATLVSRAHRGRARYLPMPVLDPRRCARLWPCLVPSARMQQLLQQHQPPAPYAAVHLKIDADSALYYALGEHVHARFTRLGNTRACQHFLHARLGPCHPWIRQQMKAYTQKLQALPPDLPIFLCTAVGKSPAQAPMEPFQRELLAPFVARCTVTPPMLDLGREESAWLELCIARNAALFVPATVGSTFSAAALALRS